MLRVYFQNGAGRIRPRWPVLVVLGVVGLAMVLLVLALLLVGAVLFIPLALIAMTVQGFRGLLRSPLHIHPPGDGRSNVRVIPRDEI